MMWKDGNSMNATVTRKGFVVGSVAASLSLAACGSRATAPAATSSDPVEVRVASLKGPTSIGLVAFMDITAYRTYKLFH